MKFVEVSSTTSREVLRQLAEVESRSFSTYESLGERIANEAEKPGHVLLVAVDGESVCGYVLFSSNSVAGRIVKVAVDPSKRRQGVGRSLMQEAIGRLHRSMSVSLHVSVKRSAALRLYQSLGFDIQETRQDYYQLGDHAYYMELQL
ncbi:hypothetical protein H257_00483 [Aphanomyces astaci]|uniref:N-acetyltransferase domain-containing protein n=1 Tax=Aphanomyces astaci TaxID=112090 RepID=W4HC14_APHAT|nr:hypothetical protein H257_00483 [Aphanomyces astaci]ETV89106.1 hypothetical protein H257_00483 [Aphanomyces astaci]|eukprot:XP_009821506.1 hypothetical protein H257_00483 [Aphanomyces astaci]